MLVYFTLLALFALGDNAPPATYQGQTIEDLPAVAEADIDLGLWALVIAKQVRPDLDVARYLRVLDKTAAAVVRGLPAGDDDMAKLMIAQMVIYQPGWWNEQRVYRYDQSDPLGDKGDNRLLSTYIDTRLGNCVSMPTFYMAVLQRVDAGLELFGVELPHHLFFRMRNRQTGAWINMEATNGTTARDIWLAQQTGVSEAQIKSGFYMKNLTKKQYLAVLMRDLEGRAVAAGDWSAALRLNALIERVDPDAVWVRVNRAAILHLQVEAMVKAAEAAGRSLTPEEVALAREKSARGEELFAWARLRGWTPPDPDERRKYLERLGQAP